jgi:hypothetical protein
VEDWDAHLERGRRRYADGQSRLPDDPDARQRQLTRMANAATAAGLATLMLGRPDEARTWLGRAADRYRESWDDAPPDSWGRPIGAIKARLLAGDDEGTAADARWALEAGAAESDGPIGRYAATLAYCVLGEWHAARIEADGLRLRDDFPHDVGDALALLAAQDVVGYTISIEAVLESFEQRDEYLEGVPVADTVLVLQALAARRGMAADLASSLLP